MKKKIDINKIKEKKISEKEIKKNEKDTKKKTWLIFRIPLIIDIILALVYMFTSQNLLLIPIAILFTLVLYGWDSHSRICPYCKKWNATVTLNIDSQIRKTEVIKKSLFRKDRTVEKKEIVTTTKCKCLHCGKTSEKQKIK